MARSGQVSLRKWQPHEDVKEVGGVGDLMFAAHTNAWNGWQRACIPEHPGGEWRGRGRTESHTRGGLQCALKTCVLHLGKWRAVWVLLSLQFGGWMRVRPECTWLPGSCSVCSLIQAYFPHPVLDLSPACGPAFQNLPHYGSLKLGLPVCGVCCRCFPSNPEMSLCALQAALAVSERGTFLVTRMSETGGPRRVCNYNCFLPRIIF